MKIGDKIKGFRFKTRKSCSYVSYMDKHIGEIGIVNWINNTNVNIKFENNNWSYPKHLCKKYIAIKDKLK